jgi:hypothetical protein
MTSKHRPTREEIDRDYWPCACVRRDKAGSLAQIKLHHKSKSKCRVCGCTREDAQQFENRRKFYGRDRQSRIAGAEESVPDESGNDQSGI